MFLRYGKKGIKADICQLIRHHPNKKRRNNHCAFVNRIGFVYLGAND